MAASITETTFMYSDSPMGKLKTVNDETASTDAGDESPCTDGASSPRTSTSEDFGVSDSEASEDCKSVASDTMLSNIAYPIMLLLQLRAGMNATGAIPRRSRGQIQRHTSQSSEVSETSWTSKQRLGAAKSARNDDEKVARTARSLLNKLTIEKFDLIFEQLANCGLKTQDHITVLMNEVFEKATLQHHFIPMYADLCVRLKGDSRINSVVGPADVEDSFQRLLLNQCQLRFEQLLEARDTEDAVDDEVRLRRKQQALGNVKLIGELLVRGMLSSKLFVECAEELLHRQKSCAEALESLATLLMVAGAKFDTPHYRYHERLREIISHVRCLTTDKSTPARVRFLLRDVLDVRDAEWTTSKNQAAVRAAPMRLEAVREHAREEHRKTGNQPPQNRNASSHHESSKECTSNGWKPSLRRSAGSNIHGSNEHCQSKNKKKHAKTSAQSDIDSVPAAAPAPTRQRTSHHYWEPRSGLTHQSAGSVAAPASTWKGQVSGRSSNEELHKSDADTDAASNAKPAEAVTQPPSEVFTTAGFRRVLVATLRELGSARNVKGALGRIRSQQVPTAYQAREFADILTRSVEELRNPIRRLAFAFVTGLAAGDQSAFDRNECFEGLRIFFNEVYLDLCDEVPRLPIIVTNELIPTLGNVFSQSELHKLIPRRARA